MYRSTSLQRIQRRRRQRVAIELPPEMASTLNKDEVKRWKNRIAAARARERTQRQVQQLQAEVGHLRDEVQHQSAMIEHLRAVIRSLDSTHCAGYAQESFEPLPGPTSIASHGYPPQLPALPTLPFMQQHFSTGSNSVHDDSRLHGILAATDHVASY